MGERILIATIGNRDPWGGPDATLPGHAHVEPTGPLLAARSFRPTLSLFLATRAVMAQAEATKAAVRAEGLSPDVKVCELALEDPSLFDESQRAIDDALRRDASTWDRLRGAEHIVVCPSSGTPQLGYGLVAVASTLFPNAEFVQALDPQHVPRGQERLRRFDPRIVQARFEIQRLLDSLDAFAWRVADAIAQRLLELRSSVVDPHRKDIAALGHLARALAAADDLDFERAAEEAIGPEAGHRRALDELQKWFRSVADRKPGNYQSRPRELAAAAARAAESGLLTRSLVLVVTALEAAARERLKEKPGFDPERVSTKERAGLPQAIAERLVELPKEGRYRLEGLRARLEALKSLDPVTEAAASAGEIGALERANELRNALVHRGAVPGRNEEARRVLDDALEQLDALFERWGWGSWKAAPTAPGQVKEFLASVRRSLIPSQVAP